MQGFDWKHDEVSLIKDIKDFRYAFKNPEKFVLTRVLQKLIFLQSNIKIKYAIIPRKTNASIVGY